MNEELIAEFMKIGCKSTREAAISFQTYLQLSEVKKYWDITYEYDLNINHLYFTAKKSRSSEPIIFVPVAVSDKINFNDMLQYFKMSNKNINQSVCLVICSPDSTCVYYNITNGISDPPSESTIQSKEDNQEKIDKELIKNKVLLEEAAMYGLPITLLKDRTRNVNDSDHYSD